MKRNKLTPEERAIIIDKGTEPPHTGKLLGENRAGIYLCRQCDAPLYRSEDKFESHCGWPSFDDEIKGAIRRITDLDGRRTEIICARCAGHLGHVFLGEGLTEKDTRHCVNSLSMRFVSSNELSRAYFAEGCFWGSEYFFGKAQGVIESSVGYMGGHKESPTYEEVCTGSTGHYETVEVVYDANAVSYEELVRLFFETHDFTQRSGQGPDIGEQYLSVAFYATLDEKNILDAYIKRLEEMGYNVATRLRPVAHFWPAEIYHQDYYDKKGGRPYCHTYKKVF